jgi:ABC-2 type transport system permease protein
VRASHYIVGNGLAGLAIIVVQILFIQLLMKYAFRIETFVPDLPMFAVLFLFGLVAVGFGMAITAFSRSSMFANVLSNLIITPSCMIAGCFWPAELMPQSLKRLSYFVPQRWALAAVQKAQVGGGSYLLVYRSRPRERMSMESAIFSLSRT